jgi:UDP-N-acetylglucosamine 4,6-dehydratase
MVLKGSILITGGTGSLGHAIVSRAELEGWNCQFTIFSRDEVKQSEMKRQYPSCKYILGDIRDLDWLKVSMRKVDTVIHTAAYKQVPSSEVNAGEAVKTNVVGSLNVAMAAVAADVGRVVGISTDKACAPINLYGCTKAAMEKLFQQACDWGDTVFTLTRYGNILGSRGSVVPFFQAQAKQGLITITDPSMTRFWLTIDQGVSLVILALDTMSPGVIIVPEAPASSMAVLAEAVAPGVEQKIIGPYPGEKVNELLIQAGESMHTMYGKGHFLVYPANQKVYRPLDYGFEYTSDVARQLTVDELRDMLYSTGHIKFQEGGIVKTH